MLKKVNDSLVIFWGIGPPRKKGWAWTPCALTVAVRSKHRFGSSNNTPTTIDCNTSFFGATRTWWSEVATRDVAKKLQQGHSTNDLEAAITYLQQSIATPDSATWTRRSQVTTRDIAEQRQQGHYYDWCLVERVPAVRSENRFGSSNNLPTPIDCNTWFLTVRSCYTWCRQTTAGCNRASHYDKLVSCWTGSSSQKWKQIWQQQ